MQDMVKLPSSTPQNGLVTGIYGHQDKPWQNLYFTIIYELF